MRYIAKYHSVFTNSHEIKDTLYYYLFIILISFIFFTSIVTKEMEIYFFKNCNYNN